MLTRLLTAALALALTVPLLGANTPAPATQPAGTQPAAGPALRFKMRGLDGKEVDLTKYQGKVVLMVNVASRCGNTPQYKPLEAVYERYRERGLAVLGFPANNFGGQEPGTDSQIKEFCQQNYGVKFDMFSKISVKGDDKAPLYKYLTEQQPDEKMRGDIKWNFEKFLVNRKGEVVARFDPPTQPDDKKVIEAIERELAKGA